MIVECNSCKIKFEVDTRKYNSYRKNGWNFYCKNCGKPKAKVEVYKCPQCGQKFERKSYMKPSKYGLYFCSQSCAASYNNSHYRLGVNNPNFIDGKRGNAYMKLAFRAFKHKCAMCGLEEECCLQVHHIDRNRDNNELDNLIILCANCHNRVHRGGKEITEEILLNRELV